MMANDRESTWRAQHGKIGITMEWFVLGLYIWVTFAAPKQQHLLTKVTV
jgi:hypothetical protein